jgi:membrane associated rhomboid family serine protease
MKVKLTNIPAMVFLIVITSIITGLQFIYPEVLSALRRHPGALSTGEWWYLITPLFVHSDGWPQFLFNMASLAFFGITVEPLFGSSRFLVLYFVSGLTGQAAGYAWSPEGAGNSVAVCGLIGSLLVLLLIRNRYVKPFTSLFILYYITSLIGQAFNSYVLFAVLILLIISAQTFLLRQKDRMKWWGPFVGIASLLGAIVMTLLHNNHGLAILAGICVTLLMLLDPKLITRLTNLSDSRVLNR